MDPQYLLKHRLGQIVLLEERISIYGTYGQMLRTLSRQKFTAPSKTLGADREKYSNLAYVSLLNANHDSYIQLRSSLCRVIFDVTLLISCSGRFCLIFRFPVKGRIHLLVFCFKKREYEVSHCLKEWYVCVFKHS